MGEIDYGRDLGVDWVDVSAEPHHVEQFRIRGVRVYEVTIAPGNSTLFHRHHRDTIYIRTTTGRSRSDEPGHQLMQAVLGRSTGVATRARLRAGRRLSRGWVQIPVGTVLLQPHHSLPLIHRVIAHPSNQCPLRIIGVELERDYLLPQPLPETRELRAEAEPGRWPAYRLRLRPHAQTRLALRGGGVLVVVSGTASLPDAQGRVIESGHSYWLATDFATVRPLGDQGLNAVVIAT